MARAQPSSPARDSARLVPISIAGRVPRVALVGAPNTGKTSLFNALTGFRRHVANYPGVTVDVAEGPIRGLPTRIDLLDLPGCYSLDAVAPDERVTVQVLQGAAHQRGAPEAILVVVDAADLRRTMFLAHQVLELGRPTVVALNMIDVARRRGLAIDCDALAKSLGCPVVAVCAPNPDTLPPLRAAIAAVLQAAPRENAKQPPARKESYADAAARRFREIDALLSGVMRQVGKAQIPWSERIDDWLTHRWFGFPLLLLVLFTIFQLLFVGAQPLTDGIDAGAQALSNFVAARLSDGPLRSLICDGLIGGVGGVVVFLPQIMLLFAAIAALEDCGYLARAAFMLDRPMRLIGLSGRTFIPLLSAFACAVPAILGARSIPHRGERFLTILLAPFMSCSARLPVYVLFIAAFVPDQRLLGGVVGVQGLVMFAMYLVGAMAAIPLAWLIRRTVLRGAAAPFVLELPSYQRPRLRAIYERVIAAAREFLWRAGTLIVIVNLIVWALAYFPRSTATAQRIAAEPGFAAESDEVRAARLQAAYLEDSYLGRVGHWIEPAVRPIGWDWRIGMAAAAAFPAREVVIGTMGTIFGLGADQDESSTSLRDALRSATWPDGRRLITLPTALSIMVFFALCAQCSSTLVVMGRELRSWRWPVISFIGMTTIAYLGSWVVFNVAAALLHA